MNRTMAKNNIYKKGEYNPNRSMQMAREKASSIEPSRNQVKYRDDLYKFCIKKGIAREGFTLRRTKQGISSNIRALISILEKNGLEDEFFGGADNSAFQSGSEKK